MEKSGQHLHYTMAGYTLEYSRSSVALSRAAPLDNLHVHTLVSMLMFAFFGSDFEQFYRVHCWLHDEVEFDHAVDIKEH